MAMEASEIARLIKESLPDAEVKIEDLRGDGDHYAAQVVSAAFAVCALLLASVGLYGLLAFTVAERTNEIGIRMALGAQVTQVLGLVMGQGTRLVLIGTALGLGAALALSRLLKSLLFGVTAHDPATFVSVTALLIAISLIAVLIPARRAAQVDPIVALRDE